MKVTNIIIILGPPGSGKGTQGKKLAEDLHYEYVSMGQVLRNYADTGSDLGLKIKEVIDAGRIIPDSWIKIIFHEVMMNLPDDCRGLILDGFPRDLDQEPILEDAVSRYGIEKIQVLFIEVPEEKLRERLNSRGRAGSLRADDDPKIFDTRFDQYRTRTFPLKAYLAKQGLLLEINGDQSIENVAEEIKNKLAR
ncbi:MAG TPA: nucleoside monophosphate kinase [Patescibacteria group bacterium]|nr:nucleoside monophosphate kinase [Patescibacteria group bacterium]